MSSEISEQHLPGIGRRYTMRSAEGGDVVVVVHNTGRRDLYVVLPGAPVGEPEATVTLTDDQARRLGAVLGGSYFTPAVASEVQAVIGDLLIDWVTLRDDSPGAGHSIAELEVRRRTRMTIVAILRGDESILAPEPTETLSAGDRLVVIGRQEDLGGFLALVVG